MHDRVEIPIELDVVPFTKDFFGRVRGSRGEPQPEVVKIVLVAPVHDKAYIVWFYIVCRCASRWPRGGPM